MKLLNKILITSSLISMVGLPITVTSCNKKATKLSKEEWTTAFNQVLKQSDKANFSVKIKNYVPGTETIVTNDILVNGRNVSNTEESTNSISYETYSEKWKSYFTISSNQIENITTESRIYTIPQYLGELNCFIGEYDYVEFDQNSNTYVLDYDVPFDPNVRKAKIKFDSNKQIEHIDVYYYLNKEYIIGIEYSFYDFNNTKSIDIPQAPYENAIVLSNDKESSTFYATTPYTFSSTKNNVYYFIELSDDINTNKISFNFTNESGEKTTYLESFNYWINGLFMTDDAEEGIGTIESDKIQNNARIIINPLTTFAVEIKQGFMLKYNI